jgi:hypothetical protein
MFPDDAACAKYLEAIRWRDGFQCPKCQATAEPFRFANRPQVLRCKGCKRDTALTAGTVMERTHTPLSVWFGAAFLISSLTPGMSAVQLQRLCGRSERREGGAARQFRARRRWRGGAPAPGPRRDAIAW